VRDIDDCTAAEANVSRKSEVLVAKMYVPYLSRSTLSTTAVVNQILSSPAPISLRQLLEFEPTEGDRRWAA